MIASPVFSFRALRRTLLAVPALLLATAGVSAQDYEGYTYFRAVDGRAELIAADSGDRNEVETNYPVITGDRLLVDRDTRVDLLLSDGSQLAVDEVSDLTFEAVAGSPDTEDSQTHLRLYEGRLLLASHGVWRDGADAAIVDTANARIYLQANGQYLVTADEARWTEVVVRDGFAEVVDQNGSSVVRAGERLEVRGRDDPRTSVAPAGSLTSLESFADRQEVLASRDVAPGLDEPVYGTASLSSQGDWVVVDGRQAWRPTVRVREWRPYWRGRWAHTPGGLYWVSYDPWSPVVYHYGAWDYHAAYGWVWYPGRVYSPGHVYWYWGPTYAGWVPRGYYDRYYRSHYGFDFGFRFGVFGHVGGSFDWFDRWTFCPVSRFGYRGYSHYVDVRSLRYLGHGHLERGYLFTDSRRVTPDRWHRPELVQVALDRGWRAERGLPERGGGPVADVTPFVQRQGPLSPDTERQVLVKGRRAPRTDDPFSTRVAANRPLRGDGVEGSERAVSARRPTGRDGGVSAGDGSASVRSRSGSPRAITPRPGDASGRSVTRPSTGRDEAGTARQAPARRVVDGIRGRSQGSDRAGDSTSSRRPTVTPDSGRRTTTTPRATSPPSRGSSTRSTAPRSGGDSSRRVTAPPSRSSGSSRASEPPSRGSSTRSTAPRSGGDSSRRVTAPPSRSSGSSRASEPPSRSSSTRSTAPRSGSSDSRATAPRSRSSVDRSPPSRSTSRRSTAPPDRSAAQRSSSPRRQAPRSSARTTRGSTQRSSEARSSSSRRQTPSAGRSAPSRGRAAASSGSSSRSRVAPPSRDRRPASSARSSSRPSSRSGAVSRSGSSARSRASSSAPSRRSSARSAPAPSRSRSSARSSAASPRRQPAARSSSGSSRSRARATAPPSRRSSARSSAPPARSRASSASGSSRSRSSAGASSSPSRSRSSARSATPSRGGSRSSTSARSGSSPSRATARSSRTKPKGNGNDGND